MDKAYKYFVGISLPEEFAQKVSNLQSKMYDQASMLRPLVPHITLLPPPSLTSLEPITFSKKIEEISKGLLPFDIYLKETGTFENRVVFINIESQKLIGLQLVLSGLLPEQAQSKLRPNFTAHLTLAQAKQYKTLPPDLIEKFKAKVAHLLPQKFEIQNLSIFIWKAPRTYMVQKV